LKKAKTIFVKFAPKRFAQKWATPKRDIQRATLKKATNMGCAKIVTKKDVLPDNLEGGELIL